MADNHERGSSYSAATITVGLLLFLLVGYVLSVGPVFWLVERGIIPGDEARTFYAPMRFLAESCPPFRVLLNFYLRLCGTS